VYDAMGAFCFLLKTLGHIRPSAKCPGSGWRWDFFVRAKTVAGCKCQIVHPRFDRRSAATSGLLGDGDPLLVDGPFRPPRHGSAYE